MFEHSTRKPNGLCIITDVNGNVKEIETLMCGHCGNHFQVVKGSGRERGFCLNCMRVTCGGQGCVICLPFEKRLDLYEKGKISKL